jgi:putative sigma-54 modulation protein
MTIKLDVQGRELEVTDRIREYAEKKVSKLQKFLGTIEEIYLDLEHFKTARSAADRYAAQLTVRGKGFMLRSEERADDIRPAIDAALEKMQRQVARYKGKHHRGRGDGKSAAEVAPDPEFQQYMDAVAAESAPIISRRKGFELIAMDEMEAVEQMQLLGHENFFIFLNVQSNTVNVLYRRNDGTYGLIEPRVR